jgi:Flp pilus assembly protein TadB
MVIQLLIPSVILGVLLGVLLGYGVVQEWQLRVRRKRDIDRLIEQFQALFRQINQENQQRP